MMDYPCGKFVDWFFHVGRHTDSHTDVGIHTERQTWINALLPRLSSAWATSIAFRLSNDDDMLTQ